MKQKLYILGIVTTVLIFTGTIFKVSHWPGAGYMLTGGLVILILFFIPAALINHYRAEGSNRNKLIYIITWVTSFIVFTSMLFKIMHWPYAGVLMTLALPFPYVVFLPVFLYVTSRNKNYNIYNTVFILLLLALNSVFGTLLALNVSKERIEESFNLSQNYYRLENVLSQFTVNDQGSQIIKEIDYLIELADYYQARMLQLDMNTPENWHNDPRSLVRSDSRVIPSAAIATKDSPPGIEMVKGIRKLIAALEKTPGYEGMAEMAKELLDFNPQNGEVDDFVRINLIDNSLGMALIGLDGLKADLLLMKIQASGIK